MALVLKNLGSMKYYLVFFNNKRIHLSVANTMVGYQGGNLLSEAGKRHFTPLYGESKKWQPTLKVDVPRPKDSQAEEFGKGLIHLIYVVGGKGKKILDFEPTDKPPRAQRLHLCEEKSTHQEDMPYGIKTFVSSSIKRQHSLEQMMTRKNRVGGVEEMRNNLAVTSLGDKSYKHPDYSINYFKDGGLIPGANIGQKKVSLNQLQDQEMATKLKGVAEQLSRGMKWTDRVKQEARKQDQDTLDELDRWVEGTLKEANPNYRDPDLFFENMEKQAVANPREVKKGGKK